MGKIIKTTLVRRTSQLPKLKSTGYSIILGRNLVKKQKIHHPDFIAKAGTFVSLEGCKNQSVHLYPKNRPKNSHSSSLEYYNTC